MADPLDDMKPMPDDWWPERIEVTGRDGVLGLKFGLLDIDASEDKIVALTRGLREAIWRAKEILRLDPERAREFGI